jgi:hypothetical protein
MQLKSTSGANALEEGYGTTPYDNWEPVLFNCRGVDFDTVMRAIESNNPRWGINTVTLEMERDRA